MRTAILISGSGSTAEAIIQAAQQKEINLTPVMVISSTPQAQGLDKAKKLKIKTQVVDPKSFNTKEDFGNALLNLLKKHQIELVTQNGWMPLTPNTVVSYFSGRIVNQHLGALDPGRDDFGGKGMYGRRVLCATIALAWLTNKSKYYMAEATTHLVTEKYDEGNLLMTKKMPLPISPRLSTVEGLMQDTDLLIAKTIQTQKKLLPIEHEVVLSTLAQLSESKIITGFKRGKQLIDDEDADLLGEAKKIAVKLFPKG